MDVGRRPGGLPHIALFLIVTALVASVQVLPSLEYSHRAIRWAGGPAPTLPGDSVPYSVHREYSLSIRELAAMILPLPARHANPYVGLTAFALALLAIRRNRWLAALALAGVLLAIAAPGYWLIYRFAPMVEKAREPAFAIVIAQAGIAILAALGLNRLRPWAAPIALALFLCEAVYHAPHLSRFDRPGSYFRMQQDQAGIMNWLKARPGWFRVDFDDEMVPYNAGDLYGIEQFGATVSSMPLNTHRNLGRADTPRRYGIRYHVGRAPAHPGQTEVFPSVFEDPGIGEPMWAIHDTPCAAPDRFRLISRYRIDATLACPGLAVVGDPYYPGWRAYLDGRRVPVQEVDGVRAVRAAAGRHTIQFRYRPGSVIWGGTLTLAGLGLAAGAVAHSRRRRAIEAT